MAVFEQRQPPIPATPRVISPSPDPSDTSLRDEDSYFPPTTRSTARRSAAPKSPPIQEQAAAESPSSDSSEGLGRARSRSRDDDIRKKRIGGMTSADKQPKDRIPTITKTAPAKVTRRKPSEPSAKPSKPPKSNGTAVNGHLSPASAAKYYWRELSRSPSPLGLIPIHREWRSFIHRHEIPRKLLHVSIGFLTLFLYATGTQSRSIPPVLMFFLVPISLVDLLRHNWPPFNRFYIRCLGAFMRETEAHEKYNGVIWYILGAWLVLRFCPKDVGGMSVMLLSWCDTAASTFGRMFGRYTPRIRRGKSLAGSLAAFVVGVTTAVVFWGLIGPRYENLGIANNTGIDAFAFTGELALPAQLQQLLGWPAQADTKISGGLALGVISVWAGFMASASEAVDIFGWDDNVTIPVLCGLGLWGFLKIFGSA